MRLKESLKHTLMLSPHKPIHTLELTMTFLTDDFLLHNDTARTLYHDYAKYQPIYDYHCHLPPADIAANRQFADLAAIWLEGDHYKWRGLRTLGIPERLITGDASPREKFQTYAEAVPHFIGNPLYHWTHLELKRPFGITTLLNGDTAQSVWDEANARLAEPAFTARGILEQMNVKMVGTTDDPCDSLEHHAAIAADKTFTVKIRPSWRPDKAIKIEHADYPAYIERLEAASGITIRRYHDLTAALDKRLEHFAAHGCLASDHGLEILRYAAVPDEKTLDTILANRLGGKTPSEQETAQFQTALLVHLGREYARRGWVMQLHIGPIRNNNSRMYARLGPDSGYDSIGDRPIADNLAAPSTRATTPCSPPCAATTRAKACAAKYSSAPAGGSTTKKTAWKRNSPPTRKWASSRPSSAC